jgi:hypothetical protein
MSKELVVSNVSVEIIPFPRDCRCGSSMSRRIVRPRYRFRRFVFREWVARSLGGHCRVRRVVAGSIGSWLVCETGVVVRGGGRIGRGERVFRVVYDSICCVSSISFENLQD